MAKTGALEGGAGSGDPRTTRGSGFGRAFGPELRPRGAQPNGDPRTTRVNTSRDVLSF
jgi:hypothetical protein